MKSVLKAGLLIIFISAIYSCSVQQPISSAPPQNNDTYEVEYLFEHEGCKVFRFYDNGNYVYFTNCTGDVTSFQNDSTSTRVENKIRVN